MALDQDRHIVDEMSDLPPAASCFGCRYLVLSKGFFVSSDGTVWAFAGYPESEGPCDDVECPSDPAVSESECYNPITEEEIASVASVKVEEYSSCCDYISRQNNYASQSCGQPQFATPEADGSPGRNGIKQEKISIVSGEVEPITLNELAQILTGAKGSSGEAGGPSSTGLLGICEALNRGVPCPPEPIVSDCPPIGSQEQSTETEDVMVEQYIQDFMAETIEDTVAEYECAPLT